jgi:hypothetical protein
VSERTVNHLDFAEMINKCRNSFGVAPRRLSAEDARAFKLNPSLMMRLLMFLTGDKLRSVLREQHILRDQGRLVWGALVQANQILFDPRNRMVLPANVIYSPDAHFDGRVEVLQELASGIFDLKGSSADDEMEQFARAVTNETARTMRLPLPRSLCEGKEAYFTTCLIQPAHLPGGCLAAGFFPLVICPEKTDAVMILPASYWPKQLRDAWA